MKKKTHTVHKENIKQAICMQVTFILYIKLQKEHFLVKYDSF